MKSKPDVSQVLVSKPEEIRLSNGIPVILQHYDGGVAATYWWIKTGSADERPAEAGFAHFLEHMLFKDAAAKETGRPSTGQMAHAIESLGGDINAYTSFDQTVYHVTCAERNWERVLDVFGKIGKPQRFLKSDFTMEREVILEELRKNEDSPGRQFFQQLFSTTYKNHPYGKPVIGFVKTLNQATVSTLEAFYKRRYVSENMGLIAVGPLDDLKRKKKLIAQLEKLFGGRVIPKKGCVPAERKEEHAFRNSFELKKQPFDVQTPTLAFSWRMPGIEHSDIPALDLLSGVLGMGELSRLYQRLFYKEAMVTDVSSGLYVPHDPGMLYFQMEYQKLEQTQSVVDAFCDEIRRIQKEGPSQEEIDRVIVNIESEKSYSTQTADGIAGRLGFLKYLVNDLDYDRSYLDRMKELDGDQIREVALRYFDIRRMGAVLMYPKAAENSVVETIAELVEARAKEFFTLEESKETPEKRSTNLVRLKQFNSSIYFQKRDSGIRVIFHPRPSSKLVSAYATAFGGLRLEKNPGSSYMMGLTWAKGTQKYNANQISKMVEGRAASLDGFSGRNAIGLHTTGLAQDWKTLSELFTDVLVYPSFPSEEVEHSRRVVEDAIHGIEENSGQLCSRLFLETLFENHPYGRSIYGTVPQLKAIQSSMLQEEHHLRARPESWVLSIVGNARQADVDRWVDGMEQQLASQSWGRASLIKEEGPAPEPVLKGPRWVERKLGREQIHIMMGGIGLRVNDSDRYALKILMTILGGQSGRLFIELREKKSLAYTVAPVSFEGVEPGYLGCYIACAPAKRKEATDGMRAVLEKLAEKGPTSNEMKRAKEYYLGHRAMDLQSDSDLAAHYALQTLYGISLEDELQIAKRIESISAQQVQRLCEKYFVRPHWVTSVVG